jgi:cytochrome c556
LRKYFDRLGSLSDGLAMRGDAHREGGMGQMIGAMAVAAAIAGFVMAAVAAPPEENQAAFVRRDDMMKELGRNLNSKIGRVASGRLQFSQDTVTSAENVAHILSTLPTLFPPGSDVADSHLKSEIWAIQARFDQLVAAVQADAAALLPVVRTGDKAQIAVAYKVLNDACNACHNEFRKPYE